jgi:hypothetical protein
VGVLRGLRKWPGGVGGSMRLGLTVRLRQAEGWAFDQVDVEPAPPTFGCISSVTWRRVECSPFRQVSHSIQAAFLGS